MTTEPAEAEAPEPADPAPEAVPDAATPEAPSADSAQLKPRRRGRTALIMAVAVVLGVLGGGGVGYAVQYHRQPTPLPPLSVAQPQYPTTHAAAPVLSPADDDMVRTDGDLTKLLVPAPRGSKAWAQPLGEGGWLTLSDLSENYTKPGVQFGWLLDHNFRRAAVNTWMEGAATYEVDLIQFDHAHEDSDQVFVTTQDGYAKADAGGSQYRTPIPGADNGGVYTGPNQLHYPDGTPYYRAAVLAVHGDIALAIWVYSPSQVSSKSLMTLAQSQLERL